MDKVQYFFDTEFDDKSLELISIGITTLDDRHLYLQNSQFNFAICNPWVVENVLPHLLEFKFYTRHNKVIAIERPDNGVYWASKAEIAERIRDFVNADDRDPEFWAYYGAYDWVIMCKLFGGTFADIPENFPFNAYDIKQLLDDVGNPKMPKGKYLHYALDDARWNRDVYTHIQTKYPNHPRFAT